MIVKLFKFSYSFDVRSYTNMMYELSLFLLSMLWTLNVFKLTKQSINTIF